MGRVTFHDVGLDDDVDDVINENKIGVFQAPYSTPLS